MQFNHQLKHKSSILITILSIIVALGLAGCGSDSGGQSSGPKTQVTVQMAWSHEYSAAGYYAAEHNGHFAEQNLEVRLQEGGFNAQGYIDPVAKVLAGEADFGATSASSLLLARSEGKPVVAVATVLQRSPFALISLAENNIVHPSDLVGKRVAVSEGGATAIYQALLTSQGIDPSQVNTVPRTSFGIDPLINKEVDVLGGWIINEGVLVQEAGLEPNFILSGDYGIDTYDSLIFTTEAMVADQPEVVERFLRAVVAGLEDVVAEPDRAIELARTYNNSLILEEQQRRMRAWLPLMKPAGSSIGAMKAGIWDLTYQILLDQGILNQPLDIEGAYNLAFLEKIYNRQAASQ